MDVVTQLIMSLILMFWWFHESGINLSFLEVLPLISKKFLKSETFFIVFDYVNILWVLECTYIYHEQ